MTDYYRKNLSASRLQQVYDLAGPRIRQYLDAELKYALSRIQPGDTVLELGCGYGRLMPALAEKASLVVGIDNSPDNLRYAQNFLKDYGNCALAVMDAGNLAFDDVRFDVTLCLQNGLSAFGIEAHATMSEAIRVTRSGGTCIFTSYSPGFWEPRLQWFRLQADHGLLGEIDEEATGDGVIVCKDGFRATTIPAGLFKELADRFGLRATVTEIDDSIIACQISVE